MQGINRLGKGPAKPGAFRPPDPNRNRTIDMFTEGAEGDIEYQRMVNDVRNTPVSYLIQPFASLCASPERGRLCLQIEEMQQRQGWLTGRGGGCSCLM